MPAERVAGASLRASPADSGNTPNEARAALEIDRAHCLKPFAVTRRHGLDPTSKHHRRARSPGVAKAQPPEMIGFHLLIRLYLTLTHLGLAGWVASYCLHST